MSDHLCWQCAAKLGLADSVQTANLLDTSYQAAKFMKHTSPSWLTTGVNSLFDDPSTQAYQNYVINSAYSGSVERDSRGTNFIWYAGRTIGATYENGEYKFPNDAVKLVLPHLAPKIHAYSVSSTGYQDAKCGSCGRVVLG